MARQSALDTPSSPHRPAASSSRASPKPRSRTGDTTIYHNGIKYTKGWMSMRKNTFRCSVYRSTGCKALLHLYSTGGHTVTGEHACLPTQPEVTHITSVTTSMKEMVDTLSIMDLSKPAHVIWKAVKSKLLPEDGAIRKGLAEEQVTSRIYRIRRKHYGSHLLGMIEVPPLSMVEGKPLNFFQFHLSRPSTDPTAKPQRIIGWAHPELRQLLMYHGVSIFIDGTFRCVPITFKQCIIVMVHDRASELYVPVYFVLCTGKTKDMYFDFMELIFRDTSEKLEPGNIVCDFEMALLDAVQKQFDKATIIWCLFPVKQAVRRRMKNPSTFQKQRSVSP